MLLNDIKNNTANITSTADFHLTNDGVSWKLDDSNTTIGNAIFGTLSNSPVSEETEDADSKEDEEEDAPEVLDADETTEDTSSEEAETISQDEE